MITQQSVNQIYKNFEATVREEMKDGTTNKKKKKQQQKTKGYSKCRYLTQSHKLLRPCCDICISKFLHDILKDLFYMYIRCSYIIASRNSQRT